MPKKSKMMKPKGKAKKKASAIAEDRMPGKGAKAMLMKRLADKPM